MYRATRQEDAISTAADHAELAARVAQQRDRDAFGVLFDYYAPRLNSYLIRLRIDRGAAEEVTQDVMATLWNKADLFDPAKSSLATWLYRIARNRRIDLRRRDRVDYLDPSASAFDVVDVDHVLPDVMVDMQARETVLRRAILGLPPEQAELVQLAFFKGLSHSEIAGDTGLPLGTVKSRIRLAFSRLRRSLEAHGVETAV